MIKPGDLIRIRSRYPYSSRSLSDSIGSTRATGEFCYRQVGLVLARSKHMINSWIMIVCSTGVGWTLLNDDFDGISNMPRGKK